MNESGRVFTPKIETHSTQSHLPGQSHLGRHNCIPASVPIEHESINAFDLGRRQCVIKAGFGRPTTSGLSQGDADSPAALREDNGDNYAV
jgi:hypothetical protein